MTRSLGMAATLVAAGGLTVGTAAFLQEQPKTVKVQLLAGRSPYNLYLITGGGGNAVALVRDKGVVLVDTKSPGWSDSVRRAIEDVTDLPVTTIINTQADGDHTGGNTGFPTVNQIIAHQRTASHMGAMDAFAGPNARFLPNTLVADKLSLFDGSDQIELRYFGAAHTDGDLVVIFPQYRVAYLGDLFPSKAAPALDSAWGGSGVAFPQTLTKALTELRGVADRVVAGHEGARLTLSDLEEYADFNREFLEAVQGAIRRGKTAAEAAATLGLPDRYRSYDMQRAKMNVAAIYEELRR